MAALAFYAVSAAAQVERVKALIESGQKHEKAGELEQAERDYVAARAEAERIDSKSAIAEASGSLGYLQYYRGDMNEALANFQRAYELASAAHDAKGRRTALMYIAHVYADAGVAQYDRALEYYRQLLPELEAAGDAPSIANTYFDIASTYDSKGDSATALEWFRRALAAERALGRKEEIAQVQRSMAISLRKLGRYGEAIPLLDDALRTFTEAHDDDAAMAVRQSRGIVLRHLGRLSEAIADLEATRAWFAKTDNTRFLEKSQDELAAAYSDAGRWKDAYAARTEHVALQRKLADKLREEQTSRMRVQFDSEKKEQENRALVTQNEAAARIRRLQSGILIFTALAIAVLAYFAYRLRNMNRQLTDAQEKLARFADASGEALRDVRAWSRGTAAELATTIRAKDISVFITSGRDLVPLSATTTRPPSLDEVESLSYKHAQIAASGNALVPAPGLTGKVFGALTISGKTTPWSDSERQLINTFAHQLGGALELQQVRTDLAEARERNLAARRQMTERGIRLLHVCHTCARCFDDRETRCPFDDTELDGSRILPYRIAARYRLARVLGSGGMGEVFAARDERLERDVAVKVIKASQIDANARSRFDREARAAARIKHPNVVSIYDSGELEEGSAYIVTELLEGRDLSYVLDKHGRGTPKQVAQLVRQGVAALAAAHAAGLVHRDVKPANLFLANGPNTFAVKLVDFGIAKTLELEAQLTQTGAIIGTPAYMAPEQLTTGVCDARSDFYSFATVAYEALTGVRASGDAGGFAALLDVIATGIASPSKHRLGVTPGIDALFASAFAKDPAQRPANVREWAEKLADELERLPATERGWPQPIVAGANDDTVIPDAPSSELTPTMPLQNPQT